MGIFNNQLNLEEKKFGKKAQNLTGVNLGR
jgi:hypothetical protein